MCHLLKAFFMNCDWYAAYFHFIKLTHTYQHIMSALLWMEIVQNSILQKRYWPWLRLAVRLAVEGERLIPGHNLGHRVFWHVRGPHIGAWREMDKIITRNTTPSLVNIVSIFRHFTPELHYRANWEEEEDPAILRSPTKSIYRVFTWGWKLMSCAQPRGLGCLFWHQLLISPAPPCQPAYCVTPRLSPAGAVSYEQWLSCLC